MNRLIILSLFLVGCTAPQTEPDVIYRVQPVVCDKSPIIQGTSFQPVVFEKAITQDGRYVLGLDGENYTNLALNVRGIIEHVRTQKAFSDYLLGCINRHNAKKEP